MKKRTIFAFAAAAALLLAGCANYMLGTTLPAHLKTINVATFTNQTTEPGIESTVTSAVRREFQRDGQLKVLDSGDADILLTAVLVSYDVESKLYDRNNTNKTRLQQATISCKIDAVERETGKTIVSKVVQGDKTFPVSGDIVTARRNALKDVANDLAKEVVDAVVSAW